MAKRFTATELWEEDWFLDMPNEYKLFWFYMKDRCDHAGLFKVNTTTFNKMNDSSIDSELAFEYFNKGKKRIRKVNGSSWLIEDFFLFQYGEHFNTKNRMHESILKLYNKAEVKLGSIRGLIVVCDTLKDKDKDKV
jgi:hypothetical protein